MCLGSVIVIYMLISFIEDSILFQVHLSLFRTLLYFVCNFVCVLFFNILCIAIETLQMVNLANNQIYQMEKLSTFSEQQKR